MSLPVLTFAFRHTPTTAIHFYDALSQLFSDRLEYLDYDKVFVVLDETVDRHYGNLFKRALAQLLTPSWFIVLPDGESVKTLSTYQYICDTLLDHKVRRNSLIISMGGGSICNIAGFVASTILRGITLIHIPTTLLAQNDAAIGHKQAINTRHGKNLLGSYYSPTEIWIVFEFLSSLPRREIVSGIAESIKHGAAQDRALFDYLAKVPFSHSEPDLDPIRRVIYQTIQDKITLMEKDPEETGVAAVLQYGHVIGHAVEFISGFNLKHGEAVAIGMYCAGKFSNDLGILCRDDLKALEELLQAYGLPHKIPHGLCISDIMSNLDYNKLSPNVNKPTFTLLRTIGEIYEEGGNFLHPLEKAQIESMLSNCY